MDSGDTRKTILNEGAAEASHAMYETDALVSQYCEAHYGPAYFEVPNFPKTCARICLKMMKDRPKQRALDLGCAVGRTAFELAREFARVDGLDFSARFIKIAIQIKKTGSIRYELVEEGDIVSLHERRLSEFGLDASAGKVAFHQADAADLKPEFTGYDLVFAGNLIDRMARPTAFLTTIHERLNPGGLLVLASPYTWLEDFTRKEHWIGGFQKDGKPYSTLDGLTAVLTPHLAMIDTPRDIPFVIRETNRKFQHTLAQMTVWQHTA